MNAASPEAVGLEEVLRTDELNRRPSRPADFESENAVLLSLTDSLSKSPGHIFERLVEAVLALCHAQSAGISLLNRSLGQFYWPAVAGEWRGYAGGGTPREFGPCGTVLDRDAPQLFAHPERHFTYLQDASPPIEEGLLVPFHIDGQAVGTIWAVSHDARNLFDAEDERVLESLSKFTATAYVTLREIGAIDPAP